MRALVVFATFLAIFHFGHALNCYKCNGCETASTLKETCRNVDPDTQRTSCVTQKIRTGGTADAMTIKKCVAYGKDVARYVCPTLPTGDTVFCDTCDSDYCNSARKITSNLYLYISICVLSALTIDIFYN